MHSARFKNFWRCLSALLCLILAFDFVVPIRPGQAQGAAVLDGGVSGLPSPGQRLGPSPAFAPVVLKGIKVDPENALQYDFIVNRGDADFGETALRQESLKLIRYFLTALTIPDEDLWVNLSPQEQDRIITDSFGRTEMGRDLLEQDYLLKQLTASLFYPEGEPGQVFWKRLYAVAAEKYGIMDIPVSTFNRVWIVPEKAVLYVKDQTAVVVQSRLKVMLEEDYLALAESLPRSPDPGHQGGRSALEGQDKGSGLDPDLQRTAADLVRELLIPEIEREVNSGRQFAPLRQIYHSFILATWFKRHLRRSLLGRAYVDQQIVKGVDLAEGGIPNKIYQRYLAAYKEGVYNYIKEEVDARSQAVIPRRYFSGGVMLSALAAEEIAELAGPAQLDGENFELRTEMVLAGRPQSSPVSVQRPADGPRTVWREAFPLSVERTLAGAAFLAAAPLMIVIAVLIKLEDPRAPVFFFQERIFGFRPDGTAIIKRLIKFRTMIPGDHQELQGKAAMEGDPRITRVGLILRKTRLDELPQLLQVANGTARLVGFRPRLVEMLSDKEIVESEVYQQWKAEIIRQRLTAGILPTRVLVPETREFNPDDPERLGPELLVMRSGQEVRPLAALAKALLYIKETVWLAEKRPYEDFVSATAAAVSPSPAGPSPVTPSSDAPGGIALITSADFLEERGDEMAFAIPAGLERPEGSFRENGLSPVIYQIRSIPSLSGYLGMAAPLP